MAPKQIDCFKIIFSYYKFLGLWPRNKCDRYFKFYSALFIGFFDIAYVILLIANIFFLPMQLDILIEEMIFTFTEVSNLTKILTFVFMREKIEHLLEMLESAMFQPDIDDTLKIVEKAKRFTVLYWKIITVMSYGSSLTHIIIPLVAHLILPVKLELPVCSYSFLPENVKQVFIYPLYLYQCLGIHFHMLSNVNIDSFFLGLIILSTAQCEVLNYKLKHVTRHGENLEETRNDSAREYVLKLELDKCFKHFDEIARFYSLVEEVLSVALFVANIMSSCIICVCLMRFTLPAPSTYYIFLSTYMTVITILILVPCWFGTRMMEESSALSFAIYNCDWTARPSQFKTSMRLFVERMKRPLSITAMKMFPISLVTFTKVMNSTYSFFTLLRHVQTREA